LIYLCGNLTNSGLYVSFIRSMIVKIPPNRLNTKKKTNEKFFQTIQKKTNKRKECHFHLIYSIVKFTLSVICSYFSRAADIIEFIIYRK